MDFNDFSQLNSSRNDLSKKPAVLVLASITTIREGDDNNKGGGTQRERAKYMKERSDNEYLDFSC